MTYRPLNIKSSNNTRQAVSIFAPRGVKKTIRSQFMSLENALEVTNYLPQTDDSLEKRPGQDLVKLLDAAGGPIYFQTGITKNILVSTYRNKLVAYDKSTDTTTTIYTFAEESTTWSGFRYGDYLFVSNGKELTRRCTRRINYDGQLSNFVVGDVVTGGWSGATAVILKDTDGGATGTLELGSINGTFEDNEPLTTIAGGSAAVAGAIYWGSDAVEDMPICEKLTNIGPRAYCSPVSDRTAVGYSKADSGINPPFTDWTISTDADDAGLAFYRNAGQVNSIVPFGDAIVVFAEFGKWAFRITTIDSNGTLKKIDQFIRSQLDMGGASGAITTIKGVFYANGGGMFQLLSIGMDNTPLSDQEGWVSTPLGSKYFDNINLDKAQLLYDNKRNNILLSCAKESEHNNHIILFNLDIKSFSTFSGWNHNSYFNSGGEIYAAASNECAIYQIFKGNTDGGKKIKTVFRQEINLTKGVAERCDLTEQKFQGVLSPQSNIKIAFNDYNLHNVKRLDRQVLYWRATSEELSDSPSGFGEQSFSNSAWGGNGESEVTEIESFKGSSRKIRNYYRLEIELTEESIYPHILEWFQLIGRAKGPIRRRNMSLTPTE